MLRRIASLVLACACVAIASTLVYHGFDRIRFRIVTAPTLAEDHRISRPLPDLSRLSGSTAALIVRLQGSDEPQTITIAINGSDVTRVEVPPHQDVRQYVPAPIPAASQHEITLSGTRPGWRLTYLEISNVYGFSHGSIRFVIEPRERPHANQLPPWLIAIVAVTLGGLALVAGIPRPWPRNPNLRWLYRAMLVLTVAVLTIVVVAPMVSGYRILLALETFTLLLIVINAPRIHLVADRFRHRYPRAWTIAPHTIVVALILVSVGQFYERATGFSSLIRFGTSFEHRAVPALRQMPHASDEGSGYDGQFYAQIALDPFLRDPATKAALDGADYRGRRVLMPIVAYVAGRGNPWYVIQAYALLNVIAWIAIAIILLRWLPPGDPRALCAWAGCLLSDGLMTSMRYAVLEGPSVVLLAAGVMAIEQQRRSLAAGIFGLAGLVRETNVIAAAALTGSGTSTRLAQVGYYAAVVAPIALWIAYLWSIGLPPSGGGNNFALPFVEYFHKWDTTLRGLAQDGWDSRARFSLLSLIALSSQCALLVRTDRSAGAWWRIGVAYALLMTVLGPAVWEGDPGAMSRVLVPMTIAFNVLLFRGRWSWTFWCLGNLSVLHGLDVMMVPGLSGW